MVIQNIPRALSLICGTHRGDVLSHSRWYVDDGFNLYVSDVPRRTLDMVCSNEYNPQQTCDDIDGNVLK